MIRKEAYIFIASNDNCYLEEFMGKAYEVWDCISTIDLEYRQSNIFSISE